MQNELTYKGRRAGPMAGICRLLPGIVALCLCAAAAAVEMDNLYSVQVPLDPADPDSRNNAYQTALTEVLVRVTGTTAIVESEQIAELFPNPARFVLGIHLGQRAPFDADLDCCRLGTG
jgi:hypothetical protein